MAQSRGCRGVGKHPLAHQEYRAFLFFFFPPRHVQLSLYDSLGLSSPSSRTVVLPLQPCFPSPEHSCSAFKRLLSHASPHRQTGVSFTSVSRQRLCFYLPSHSRPHPHGMPTPTAPLPTSLPSPRCPGHTKGESHRSVGFLLPGMFGCFARLR